jgi:hypothetical protein
MQEDAEDKEDTDEIIFDDIDEIEKELTDNDFVDFNDFIEEDAEDDFLALSEEE